MGRSARHKILPVIAFVIAVVPAVVIVGLAVLIGIDLPEGGLLTGIYEFTGVVSTALFFYCGIIVPEILVSDRRNGMLPLYFSTPLQRWSYLTSKAIAVALTLAMLTVGPQLLVLIGHTLQGTGPDDPIVWATTLLRIVGAGFAVSAAFAAASLAAASLTDRRAFAAIGVIVLLFGSGIVAGLLVEVADMDAMIYAFDLGGISDELTRRIYDVTSISELVEEDGFIPGARRDELSTLFVTAANAAWVIVGAGIVWLRYRRLALSR